jgi:hypothetical protein
MLDFAGYVSRALKSLSSKDFIDFNHRSSPRIHINRRQARRAF